MNQGLPAAGAVMMSADSPSISPTVCFSLMHSLVVEFSCHFSELPVYEFSRKMCQKFCFQELFSDSDSFNVAFGSRSVFVSTNTWRVRVTEPRLQSDLNLLLVIVVIYRLKK